MVHEMRRWKQRLEQTECEAILRQATSGVLALIDGEGTYAVPLSYVYQDHCLYFHCAKSGHKLELLQEHPSVSFCVIDQDHVVPDEYTTYFRSVIVFGEMDVLKDKQEKELALSALAHKYAPKHSMDQIHAYLSKHGEPCLILRLRISHMSGKEAKELREKQVEQGS